MLIVPEPEHLNTEIISANKLNKPVGIIPTMGALHEGHLALVNTANSEGCFVVVSIFVNPLQFNNSDDHDKYPRDLDADLKFLQQADIDLVFVPNAKSLYPVKPVVGLDFGTMAKTMEGRYRPGHFSGVGVVVAKLFNMVRPDRAYFGLKDLQQFMIISKLAMDLSFNIQIIGVPTVRAKNGLALSSRNSRLNQEQQEVASGIHKGLKLAESAINGQHSPAQVLKNLSDYYHTQDGIDIEYCEIVNPETMQPIETLSGLSNVAICVAAHVGGVRLIDNLYLRLK